MESVWARVVVLLVVLAVAAAGGLIWRARTGRIRNGQAQDIPGDDMTANDTDERAVWAELGIEPGAAAVTLVQFSSAFCAPCRATRRILSDVVDQVPQTRHVEVDAESHLDVVRALGVRSTPTTLLVDRNGRITGRAVGQPRRNDVLAAIGPYL